MFVTVANYKGGVGKSTTAIHIAAFLAGHGKTLLADGDPNQSAIGWDDRGGNKLPFRVMNSKAAPRYVRQYEHVVIDTSANPESDELTSLAEGCDFLILPTSPEAMAISALMQVTEELTKLQSKMPSSKRAMPVAKYRVLLTMVRSGNPDTAKARAALQRVGIPMFDGQIRNAVAFTRASMQGCLVGDVRDQSAQKASDDYSRVGAEMLAIYNSGEVK